MRRSITAGQQFAASHGSSVTLFLPLAISLLAVLGVTASVKGQDELIVTASLGFNSALPTRDPCPLTLRIENTTENPMHIDIEVLSGRSLASEVILRRSMEISPKVARTTTLLVSGALSDGPMLRVTSDRRMSMALAARGGKKERVVRETVGVLSLELENASSFERGVLVMGGRARQFMSALTVSSSPSSSGSRPTVLEIDRHRGGLCSLEGTDAPDTALAYGAFTTIFWAAPDSAEMPNPAQWKALLDWVFEGGRLVILAAHRPECLEIPALAPFLRGARFDIISTPYPVPPIDALKGFSANGFSLRPRAETAKGFEVVEPSSEAWLKLRPLRSVHRLGAGSVVVALVDPFIYDLGRATLFLEVLKSASGVSGEYFWDRRETSTRSKWKGPFGVTPIVPLLENANILRPPLWLYILLGFAFVLVIGPIDYSWLKRRKQLHLSPLTLLIYTAVFSGACIAATLLLFAPDAQTNRFASLELYEGANGEERVSGHLYHGIYAPVGGSFRPGPKGLQCFGAADTQGEMHSMMGGSIGEGELPWTRQAWLGSGRQPAELRLRFNSFRATATRLTGQAEGTVLAALSSMENGGHELVVHNRLPGELDHVVFVWKSHVVELPSVPSGESRSIPLPEKPRSRHSAGICACRLSTTTSLIRWNDMHFPGRMKRSTSLRRFSRDSEFPLELSKWLYAAILGDEECTATGSQIGENTPSNKLALPMTDRRRPQDNLERGFGVLLATTTKLPFMDEADSDAAGFTFVQIQRLVELGALAE